MKFVLEGTIIFNKDAGVAKEDIEKFIKEANEEILLKGTRAGEEYTGARITKWDLNNNDLSLTIESGAKVRAHDGLLRLKNPLTKLIGKKYHLGVRGIDIKAYKLILPVDKYEIDYLVAKEFHNYIQDIINDDDKIEILLKDLDESAIKKQGVNRVIKRLVNETRNGVNINEDNNDLTSKVLDKHIPGEVVAESPHFKAYFEEDVTKVAKELGWIKEFPGRGQWFYGPEITALQRGFEQLFIEKIINPLGFYEALFPKLIPFTTLKKMRYLEGLPEGMYYCSAPKRDPEVFTNFKNELSITHEIPMDLLKKGLKDPGYVISAAQCEPFYEFLSHEVIERKELPIKLYDKSGWTYRWESGGSRGIDRVHEFQRIEMVWLGTPEQTNEIRGQTVQTSQQLANDLELEWYTEIGDDPFYLEGRKMENRDIEFPEVPKYEMRLKVPNQDKGVAVVSGNNHGTHFVQGFSIKESHQDKIWTGCTGLGLTRWIFGFLAQKGFDKENWPQLLKDRVRDVKAPKILTWPTKK
ncbi:MAG: serine--tRNA ligase [Methanobrevibacter sp.]|jgi:seryl-tRNA synthetase|nr:serine--tRNA ligase [Candidatus Methanovirga basalitermitum]